MGRPNSLIRIALGVSIDLSKFEISWVGPSKLLKPASKHLAGVRRGGGLSTQTLCGSPKGHSEKGVAEGSALATPFPLEDHSYFQTRSSLSWPHESPHTEIRSTRLRETRLRRRS